jgi:hypothetical protein
MLKLTVCLLTVMLGAFDVMGQAPTLRIVQPDGPNLPAELYYGDIKVKPLRLRPGTNQIITIDDTDFFVNQQYVDFLSRFPDQSGFDYWISQIASCPMGDQLCVNARRIAVSDAFFFEPEFHETGGFVYHLYRASLGTDPTYAQFGPDRRQIAPGAGLDQSKTAFALDFVQRTGFLAAYPANMTGAQFVDKLLTTIQNNSQVDLTSQRSSLIALYNGTNDGRAAILRAIEANQAFVDAEYNRLFVVVEYFGYLRRDPDANGFNFWLGQVDRYPLRNTDVQHAMVCSFITSTEYQLRFGSGVTHTNQECPQ